MTTPDKEEIPTEDRTAGLLPVRLEQPWAGFSCLHIGSFKIGIVVTDEDGTQDRTAAGTALEAWVTACNAYEPMREALAATTIEVERDLADFLSSVCVVRDEGPDRSTLDPEDAEEVARLECIIWRARAALSTFPVNDRHHSGSDNERNFENVRDAWKIIWEREAEIARLSRSLSELEAHHVEQNRLKRRSEADSKTLRIIRAALYGTDRQTSDDVGILRALLEEELVWHEERDKSLSKQPQSNQVVWRRAEHQERIDVIRAALKGPASEAEVL